jgi:hypothetical protein
MTTDPISSLPPWCAAAVRASRAFQRRAVIHLTEIGIDQFVDFGSGPWGEPDVAEIIHVRNPRARLVWTVGHPSLDSGRPVAALMVGVLERLPGDEIADLLRAVRQASPPGSCLAIAHLTADPAAFDRCWRTNGGPTGAAAQAWARAVSSATEVHRARIGALHPRTSPQIRELFHGYEMLRPGFVPADRWRAPGSRGPDPVPVLAGVGRLPD